MSDNESTTTETKPETRRASAFTIACTPPRLAAGALAQAQIAALDAYETEIAASFKRTRAMLADVVRWSRGGKPSAVAQRLRYLLHIYGGGCELDLTDVEQARRCACARCAASDELLRTFWSYQLEIESNAYKLLAETTAGKLVEGAMLEIENDLFEQIYALNIDTRVKLRIALATSRAVTDFKITKPRRAA